MTAADRIPARRFKGGWRMRFPGLQTTPRVVRVLGSVVLATGTAYLHATDPRLAPESAGGTHVLTLDGRVAAQSAIEDVYWRQRIWPAGNSATKPSLNAILPASAVRAKVEDYLRKSAILADLCDRPITGEDLQAELTRMAATTARPGMLRELFAALEDDPFLIAETLARQTLVDRLFEEHCAGVSRLDGPFPDVDMHDVVAGVASGSLLLPIVVESTCTDGVWTAMSGGASAPAARYRHTAVWTGAEMIVWGGDDYVLGPPSQYFDTGGRYDPATDSWSPTSTSGAVPAGRTYHTAVWTGTEMIVWGGNDGTTVSSDGGRYDPVTDTWTTMPAGPAVTQHTAVWTGTEMIVWGGNDGSAHLASGARFDPDAETWTPTSTGAGVPFRRSFHTAIWTGREMIVWGGYSAPDAYGLDSGGRYDPASDTWSATPLDAAPEARYGQTAIWTGREMIVWGGYGAIWPFVLSNGGRYDPYGDAWAATSTTNAPDPRYQHTTVWTGEEMIVWGGSTVFAGLPDAGGRYDPDADAWTPIPADPAAPSLRILHAGVWTGERMILWGGGSFDAAAGDGGRYCAVPGCEVVTWYSDDDGDGRGLASDRVLSCAAPPDYVLAGDDCDDIDPGAWAVPDEVGGLRLARIPGGAGLDWVSQSGSAGPDTVYDVVTGDLNLLRSSGSFAGATCLASDLAFPSHDDTRPPPGRNAGEYFLPRARNVCGAGTYGDSSVAADPRDLLDAAGPCP